MPLTDTACKKATCPEGRPSVRLADEKALYLEVNAAGGKYWRWKYRHGGKEKRLSFGVYPAVSLKAARDAATEARTTLQAGNDPGALRKALSR